MSEPCSPLSEMHQVITTVGNVVNMLLLTYLVNRRRAADSRERTNGEHNIRGERMDQKQIDGRIRSRRNDRDP